VDSRPRLERVVWTHPGYSGPRGTSLSSLTNLFPVVKLLECIATVNNRGPIWTMFRDISWRCCVVRSYGRLRLAFAFVRDRFRQRNLFSLFQLAIIAFFFFCFDFGIPLFVTTIHQSNSLSILVHRSISIIWKLRRPTGVPTSNTIPTIFRLQDVHRVNLVSRNQNGAMPVSVLVGSSLVELHASGLIGWVASFPMSPLKNTPGLFFIFDLLFLILFSHASRIWSYYDPYATRLI